MYYYNGRSKPVVMQWPERVLPWIPAIFEHISKQNSNLLHHNYSTHLKHKPLIKSWMPTLLSRKSPIPISPLCLTSHFIWVQIFNINVPAGVGAFPLDTIPIVSVWQQVHERPAKPRDGYNWGNSTCIPLSRQETAVVLSSQQQTGLPLLHKIKSI